MLRIVQLKLPVGHTEEQLKNVDMVVRELIGIINKKLKERRVLVQK